MTNEEKALKLADLCKVPDDEDRYFISNRCEIYDKCLEMAAWKEQQMIEKAVEWLEPVFKDLAGYYCGGDLIEDFKKVMKE